MKNLFYTLSVAVLALSAHLADAQDYVLTARGDSLTGDVRPMLYGPEQKVQLVSEDREKTTFSIFQVREFSSDGEIYHPVRGEKGYQFMKLVKPGYLALYAYQMENQTRFDGLYLKKLDGESLVVPNLGFKKYMARFLEDCPAVVTQIEEGDLGKKDVPDIVDVYNACVQARTADHDRIIATREQQSTKISAWSTLEEKIREKDFTEKKDALEMVAEIRKKIQRQESIPNFLLEGLKNSLRSTGLSAELDRAISELN